MSNELQTGGALPCTRQFHSHYLPDCPSSKKREQKLGGFPFSCSGFIHFANMSGCAFGASTGCDRAGDVVARGWGSGGGTLKCWCSTAGSGEPRPEGGLSLTELGSDEEAWVAGVTEGECGGAMISQLPPLGCGASPRLPETFHYSPRQGDESLTELGRGGLGCPGLL